ncbi:MAG: GAF domain-containing protein [Aeromicrobium sp.]|uniref:helix-turn-helix domain-containing protein n=1 Tax=Aeromicrobium sp. TaxID=1871063 RepID=UPI002612C9A8|nr:GAF domain-containing protein [Aeromicrobium sp.]MDF1704895.1 GAF domain-containing protein [Aeromicrobium sp.]
MVDEVGAGTDADLGAWLAAIADIGAAVNSDFSLPALLDLVASTACDLVGYDVCAVLVPETDREVLVIAGSSGLAGSYIEGVNATQPIAISHSPDAAPSAQAFVNVRPVVVTDIDTDPTFRPWGGIARDHGFASMVSIPVTRDRTSVATLNCYTRVRHAFDDREIELLSMLATQAANALTTAQLRDAEAATIGRLHSLNTSLEAQRDLLGQAEAIHQRLTELALDGGGIEAVTDALAELLDRSIVAEDADGGVIRAALRPGHAVAPPDLTERAWLDALDASARLRPHQAPADDRGPMFTVPVALDGDIVTVFWVEGDLADLASLERRTLEHAVTVAGLEAWRRRSAEEVEWRLAGEIVNDLVLGDAHAQAMAAVRAQRLGHDLQQPYAVLVFRPDDEEDQHFRRRLIAAARQGAADHDSATLVAPVEGRLVVLTPAPDLTAAVASADSIRRRAAVGGHRHTTSAAVGGVAVGPAELSAAYAMGRGMVDLARLRGSSGATVVSRDLDLHGLVLRVDDASALLDFIDDVLGPLRRYDTAHQSELVATLRAWITADLSTSETAAALYIHPNTVSQRLRRIEDVLGLRLNAARTIARVVLAQSCEDVIDVVAT